MAIENNERSSDTPNHTAPLSAELLSGDRESTLQIVRSQRQEATSERNERVPLPTARENGKVVNPESCPASPVYSAVINKAARHMFAPESLGDLKVALNKYNCDIHNPNDALARAKDMLKSTGDSYNTVMTSKVLREFNREIGGRLSGIGVRLMPVETKPGSDFEKPELATMVEDAPKDTPAGKAGIRRGDFIVKVNGVDTSKMSLDQVGELIGGPAGTKIDLTTIRNGATIERTLTRSNVHLSSISNPEDMGDGITYLKFFEFNEGSAKQLYNAIRSTPKSKAYVIDLRENPGGSMEDAISAAGLFIRKGTIASETTRLDSDPKHPQYMNQRWAVDEQHEYHFEKRSGKEVKFASPRQLPYVINGRPVVVLTNDLSASGAELFSGALHDHGVATVVGELSYGKGIAQTVIPAGYLGAAIKVTTAKYFTPNGTWPGDASETADGGRGPNRHGLKPDIEVKNPPAAVPLSPEDAQLHAGLAVLRQKLRK